MTIPTLMSDEEDGQLYKMVALTSKADALTSSPFKPSGNSASSEEDINETPIVRKIAERKGKEVKGICFKR